MKMFDYDKMTDNEKWLIATFCEEIIEASSKCQNCAVCHGKMCFFAWECLRRDFKHFVEADNVTLNDF